MRENVHWLLVGATAFALLPACKHDDNGATPAGVASHAGAATAAPSEAAKYDKATTKKGCELLTAESVSKTFGVPADALRRTKVMGCIYSWKDGDETVEARVSMLMVHKSEQVAATWFKNATKGVSAAEAQKTLDDAMKSVKEKATKGDLGKNVSAGAVDTVEDALTGAVSPQGTRYEDVAGLGDEARVQLGNGSVWVRVDNLTFSAAGYKGKRQPKPQLQGNLKQMVAKAQAAKRDWMAANFDQRKADSTKVAKLVLEAL